MEPIQFNIQAFGSQQVVNDINKLFEALAKATAQQKELNRQLDTLTNRTKAGAQNKADLVQQITGDPTRNKEALKTVRDALKALEKQLAELGRTAAAVNILPAGGPVSRHRQEIERLTTAYTNLSKSQRAGAAGQNLLNQIRSEARDLRQALTEVRAAQGAGPGGGRDGGLFGNFGTTLGNVLKFQAASKVIDTVAQSFVYAEETVRNFDAEVTNLLALLGSNGPTEIKELEAEALRLGRTTAFTATEVVKLQQELVKLGFSAREVQNIEGAIINFSVAVRESADRVALLTGATLKAFNLSSLEATRVVDVLTQATIRTALSFSYLETALPTVTSAAEEVGISLDDLVGDFNGVKSATDGTGTALETTAAVLGVLADRGVKASTAATSFRNILIESAKRGYTFVEALEVLNRSQNKLSTAFDLFGKRGAVQALILADNLAEVRMRTEELTTGFTDIGEKLATAKSVADIQLTSIQGRVTLLKSAWDGFLLAVGNTEVWKDASKGTLGFFTDTLNGLSALIDKSVTISEILQNPRLAGTVSTAPGDAFFNILKTGADLSQQRALIEQETKNTIEEQGRLRVGIFQGLEKELKVYKDIKELSFSTAIEQEAAKNAGLEKIKNDASVLKGKEEEKKLIDQLAIEYGKTGKSAVDAYSLATKAVNKYRESVLQTILAQKEQTANDQVIINDNLIKGLQTINSAKNIVSILEEQRGDILQIEDPKKFAENTRLLDTARKKLSELTGEINKTTGATDKKKTALEILTEQLRKYEAALRSAKTDEERASIIEKIEVTQGKIDQQIKAYEDFIRKISSITVANLPENLRKEAIKFFEDRLKIEQAIEERGAKERIKSEKVLTLELERISADFELRRLQNLLDVTKRTDEAYESLVNSIRDKFSEAFTLRFDVITAETKSNLDLGAAKARLSATQLITNELERQEVLKNIDLQNEVDILDNEIKGLETKKKSLEILSALTKTSQTLTKEEEGQLAIAKLKLIEKQRELTLSNVNLPLGIPVRSQEVDIDALKEITELQQKFINGEIEPIIGSVLGDEQFFKTSLTIFKERLAIILAEAKLAKAQLAVESTEAVLRENPTDRGAIKNNLKAIEDRNNAEIELNEEKNKDIQKQETENDRRLRRQREAFLRQTVEMFGKFGEAFGDALANGDSIKDSFKALLKDLIDMLTNYLVVQLTTQLSALLSGFPATLPQILGIGVAIAGVKAAGAGGKALIDRFEYGGLVKGPLHTNGGVPHHVKGTNYFPELEGGEFVVNRHATAKNLALLKVINGGDGKSRNIYGDGGLIQTTPQVLQPVNNFSAIVNLKDEDIIRQATMIAAKISESQIAVLVQQNESLLRIVTDSLNRSQDIEARLNNARKTATL